MLLIFKENERDPDGKNSIGHKLISIDKSKVKCYNCHRYMTIIALLELDLILFKIFKSTIRKVLL